MRADNSADGIWRISNTLGTVIKILSFEHYVYGDDGKNYLCVLRGRQRLLGEVYVGDRVEFSRSGKTNSIDKVLPRKNSLTRPYVANIDKAIIVVAGSPEPDLCLVDKLIANCIRCDIEPIILVNKDDENVTGFYDNIRADYGCFKVIKASARDGEIGEVIKEIADSTVCLCGQSAVGKTTLINALIGDGEEKTGGLSKIRRGRNTTRHVETYRVGGGWVVDTCGFSLLEIEGIKARELALYYPEFEEGRMECKFSTCTHISEPVCGVKARVGKSVPEGRYERYKILYDELKQKGGF